jgi:hypothetical protein
MFKEDKLLANQVVLSFTLGSKGGFILDNIHKKANIHCGHHWGHILSNSI